MTLKTLLTDLVYGHQEIMLVVDDCKVSGTAEDLTILLAADYDATRVDGLETVDADTLKVFATVLNQEDTQ